MLAQAFLSVTAAHEHTCPQPAGLIPLTRNEIRHLFINLTAGLTNSARHRLDWSRWRRRHQARAKLSHYRRQAATLA
jgi:hypothetical protein